MIKHDSIRIRDIHCADCVRKIEKSVSKTKGVHELQLSLATGQLNVSYDPKIVTLSDLERRVEKLGYNVFRTEMTEYNVLSLNNPKYVFMVISGVALALGILFIFVGPSWHFVIYNYSIFAHDIFFYTAMIFGGYYILKEAVAELLEKVFAIELLMLIAAIGAVLIGALPEAGAILFLFSIAELLETYATERSRRSISELIDFTPKTVTVKTNGKKTKVPVTMVRPGDIVIVRSGSYIGVDGTVVRGCSAVNEAAITGEAMPVKKELNDTVYAGTLNKEGTLEIKTTKHAHDTTLAKIIKLVEKAEMNKSGSERFMDRFAKYYTPSVVFLAFMVVVIPVVIFQQSFDVWFYKALMLILISCPCALAISTPVSIVSAITHGARSGVLFKGGVHVETAAKIDTFAFDKTGTLTKGKPVLSDIVPLEGHSEKDLLLLASSLECLSKHPLGDAIVEYAEARNLHTECVEAFRTVPGKGVFGTIKNRTYYVGGKSLFSKSALTGLEKYFNKFSGAGKSVVLIGTKDKVFGIFAFSDELREHSKQMVKRLHNSGVKRVVMLTGDNRQTAGNIAGQLGVDEYYAELLPEEKVEIIKKIGAKNKKTGEDNRIAMVGDGINDAPALAAADLGIAMGTAGTDSALETADIALMQDDLSKVPYIIKLSKKTMNVVKQNIILAISIKLLFAILVFPGLVTLWMAVAIGDMGVSLGVILNALRLGRV
jgi:Cd2+/Zn2+-exporting ATPase